MADVAKTAKVIAESGGQRLVAFWCPGCDSAHTINTNAWSWNGDLERPTFTPSVKVTGTQWDTSSGFHKPRHCPSIEPGGTTVCHSFVADGRIQFLGDCTHALAGQTVDLPPWREGD